MVEFDTLVQRSGEHKVPKRIEVLEDYRRVKHSK
jgi:hypothetical protein